MRGAQNPDEQFMRLALRLAKRGYGKTSPNPMVGAVLARSDQMIGKGWHHKAGKPHAEIEAMRDASKHGEDLRGATLYATLEPCSTFGRTPPCSQAILEAGIRKVVVGAVDPNPIHAGRGLEILRQAGVEVVAGVLEKECGSLNETFNHWIVHRTPFVILKAAMSMDGKIATKTGESKWITGPRARSWSMRLRFGMDAILVGVNTVIADDPSLTCRNVNFDIALVKKPLRRFILDPYGRIPLDCRVLTDDQKHLTTVVVGSNAPARKVQRVRSLVNVWEVAAGDDGLDLLGILERMGQESITSLLVEGGGETHARFLSRGMVHRAYFLYAPKIIGGRDAPKGVGGSRGGDSGSALRLKELSHRRLGPDLLVTGRVGG